MKAIDKAWEENLKEPDNRQFENKEELIRECCPYGEYNLKIKGFEDDHELCLHYNENCYKCWNTEIENDKESKLTFDKLKESPINVMYFSDMTENNFIKSIKNDEYIINCEDGTLTYDDIPKTIKWLQEVYDYCTELKNKVEYVNWKTARTYMEQGNSAEIHNQVYRINNDGYLLIRNGEAFNCVSSFNINLLDSKEWILL